MYPCTIPPNGFHQEDRHKVGEKKVEINQYCKTCRENSIISWYEKTGIIMILFSSLQELHFPIAFLKQFDKV